MGDPSEPESKTIPNWQRQTTSSGTVTSSEESPTKSDPPSQPEASPSRAALLKQASKFLEEDEVTNAPVERKKTFLRGKGLLDEEIIGLLNLPTSKVNGNAPTESTPTQSAIESESETPSISPPQSTSTSKDVPPIITYPEFLLHSPKPAPLITTSRLLSTFYIFSGAAAAVYGTSKYVLAPMLESMTTARHSLFETASANLDTLNEKLQETVPNFDEKQVREVLGPDDDDDASSDITEEVGPLFNRTIGTQTSPTLERTFSTSSSSSSVAPLDMISNQQASLEKLQSSLSTLAPPKANEQEPSVKERLKELEIYLDDLKNATYPATDRKPRKGEEDGISKLKQEIRSVKGVLLSARTFPGVRSIRATE